MSIGAQFTYSFLFVLSMAMQLSALWYLKDILNVLKEIRDPLISMNDREILKNLNFHTSDDE